MTAPALAANPNAAAAPAAVASSRRWELDALRGLMLVLMTLTHLPTRFSDPLSQPFGFVSAAEGFVLLSGFMAGTVYTARHRPGQGELIREAFFKRAFKIYLCQAALLVFAFTVISFIGVVGRQPAITDMVSFYLERPLTALFSGLLLLYSPPLLDILPMYIAFMLLSPLLLLHGLSHGWNAVLAISIALWVGAQFNLERHAYDALVATFGLPVPYRQKGAFDLFAWQFLWVLGLWQGSLSATQPDTRTVFPRWMVRVAWAVFIVGFTWRHAIGQTPWPGWDYMNMLFDKWRIGPLRMIDLFALIVLTLHYAEVLKQRLPRLSFFETLGRASLLPVFCAHLVLALTALAIFGAPSGARPWTVDVAILAVSFAVLYGIALLSNFVDVRASRLSARRRERRSLALSAGAGR